jgi:Xaa-Pro aminopeptidase
MADENKKPENMLEAMEGAILRTDRSLVEAFRTVRAKYPEQSIGQALRMFHVANVRTFQLAAPSDSFGPVLGFIAKYLLPHLTDEEKEALRNDKLSGLL